MQSTLGESEKTQSRSSTEAQNTQVSLMYVTSSALKKNLYSGAFSGVKCHMNFAFNKEILGGDTCGSCTFGDGSRFSAEGRDR